MAHNDRNYSNNEITVHWRPELCTHKAACIKNLPKVFNTLERPWVNINGASTKEIIRVVEMCPSGALSWSQNTNL